MNNIVGESRESSSSLLSDYATAHEYKTSHLPPIRVYAIIFQIPDSIFKEERKE